MFYDNREECRSLISDVHETYMFQVEIVDEFTFSTCQRVCI